MIKEDEEMTYRERAYEEAMSKAVMPGLLDAMAEQMRRFHAAALPFVDADGKEPQWMGAADIASTRMDMLRATAKKYLWSELKLKYPAKSSE